MASVKEVIFDKFSGKWNEVSLNRKDLTVETYHNQHC